MRAAFAAVLLAGLAAFAPGVLGAQERVPVSQAEIALSFAPVVRATAPAVVNIYARRIVAGESSPFARDPFFGPLFRQYGPAQPRMQNSLGSGVILSPDGLVVSNFHVVGGASEIRVVLNDRREFEADILLSDEEADLAVLRLRGAGGLPALSLRDSDDLEVGELVLAIGNPFGVGQTVTSGIVSGLARSGAATGSARGSFIQTDAAINPGNSGGALVDMRGRLIGINTSILTRSGGSNGIGFAIPSNLVQRFVELAQAGATRFERPWAGIEGQAVTADLGESLGLERPEGFLVAGVHPESPFARAGIRTGDVILTLDGAPVGSAQDLIYRMSVAGTGREVVVTYLRRGARAEATVRLDPPPDDGADAAVSVPRGSPLAGLRVAALSPRLLADLGLPIAAEGVVVVDPGAGLARIGLLPGDLIRAINGARVLSVADVLAQSMAATRRWAIDIERDGRLVRLRFRV